MTSSCKFRRKNSRKNVIELTGTGGETIYISTLYETVNRGGHVNLRSRQISNPVKSHFVIINVALCNTCRTL